MDIKDLPYVPGASNGRIGELVHKITDDVKTIASDELELARDELTHTVKKAASDAAVVVLGGIVALIGFGFLCTALVVVLAPVIPPLWLRLLLVAIVYLVAGGALARVFSKKLAIDSVPDMSAPSREAHLAVNNIKSGLQA